MESEPRMGWEPLGQVPPRDLRPAREQAHWAAQVIAAAGETFCAHEADTSHTSMTWEPTRLELVGRTLPGEGQVRIALRVQHLTLALLGTGLSRLLEGTIPNPEIALAGRTLAEAYRWAAEQIRIATDDALDKPLSHPGFSLPQHPLGHSARFVLDPGLAELSRWYANADSELRRIAQLNDGAGPVLCWPHHFDLATLIEVAPARERERARTVGVGLSPGDAGIDEPYFYVNHWPATRKRKLPPLEAGEWNRKGWVGAALRGSLVVAAGDPGPQEALVHAFLASALPASRELALEARFP
jgi:hypothetical protein